MCGTRRALRGPCSAGGGIWMAAAIPRPSRRHRGWARVRRLGHLHQLLLAGQVPVLGVNALYADLSAVRPPFRSLSPLEGS
jgi:hypothetical protein